LGSPRGPLARLRVEDGDDDDSGNRRLQQPLRPGETWNAVGTLPEEQCHDASEDAERSEAVGARRLDDEERNGGEIDAHAPADEREDPRAPPLNDRPTDAKCEIREAHIYQQAPECSWSAQEGRPLARLDDIAPASGLAVRSVISGPT